MISRIAQWLAVGFAASAATAGLSVTDEFGNAISGTYYDLSWNGGAAVIQIIGRYPDPNGQNIWEIRGTSGEDIELIDVQVESDDDVTSQIILRVKSMTASGIGDLVEIRQTGDEAVLLNLVDVKGYIGRIEVDTIGDVSADGVILGPIIATGINHGAKINILESRDADILASISCAGQIELIQALNGDIGSSASSRAVIGSQYYINTVQAQNIYADISASHFAQGDIFRVTATEGAFVGEIDAVDIEVTTGSDRNGIVRGKTEIDADILLTGNLREPFVVLEGDFAAGRRIECNYIGDQGRIEIGEDANGAYGHFLGDAFIGNTVGAGSPIQIDNTLAGNIVIGDDLNGSISIDGDVSSGQGLTGQIIINANNNGGAWTGDVTVGSTTLSPLPFYAQTFAIVGGGTVGLAPFNYHPVDSEPDDDSTLLSTESITTATVWYYGPVLISSGTGDVPYTIESHVLKPPSQTWTDVSSNYTVTVVGGTSRQVQVSKISGEFPVNREYRFVPHQGSGVEHLVCSQVNGSPPIHDTSADDHYSFSIPLGTLESLDFSGDGKLDSADMAVWLMNESDLDKDGKIDEDDYLALENVIENGL